MTVAEPLQSEIVKAVAQETLDCAYMARRNAAVKNGVDDIPPRQIIGETSSGPSIPAPSTSTSTVTDTTTTTTTPVVPTSPPAPTPTTAKPSFAARYAVPIASGIMAASGLGILGIAGFKALNPPTVHVPSPVIQPASGNLLQWLKKEGYNLPPSNEYRSDPASKPNGEVAH